MAKHGKIKQHKHQHFVPRCYLKSWHDPEVPPGGRITPYVWQFDKDGSNPRRRAPANLFTETDIYTIERADGERDLRLEHGLQGIEDQFTRIRNLRFARREWPDAEQLLWIHAFVATAQVRTAGMRDFHREQWARLRQMGHDMERTMREATPEQRESMARMGGVMSSDKSAKMTLDDVRAIEANPIQYMVGPVLRTVLPLMGRMHTAVLCTDDDLGFVTTDQPCTWFDPEAYKRPPMLQGAGLGMPAIEVTLPISPGQCLLITHRPETSGYIDIDGLALTELNRRHIAHCDNHFIARRNEVRPGWFERLPLPDDAWEVERARKIAAGEWSE